MQAFPQTIILRHRRENLKKCSLRGLESRSDCQFYTYPRNQLPSLDGYLLLTLDAPILSPKDAPHGLYLLDATWRYAKTMYNQMGDQVDRMIPRSLPSECRTAYPRRQEDCEDPERGLASIEALFMAYVILGRDSTGLLNQYYWRDSFLEKNKVLLDFYGYKIYY